MGRKMIYVPEDKLYLFNCINVSATVVAAMEFYLSKDDVSLLDITFNKNSVAQLDRIEFKLDALIRLKKEIKL